MPRPVLATLTEARIDERLAIVFAVDDQACQGCGRALPAGVASDPEWLIEVVPSGDELDEYVAEILCPECW